MQYLDLVLFPVVAPPHLAMVCIGKIQPEHWPAIVKQYKKNKGLRQIANEYGVSHEGVRRTLQQTGILDLAEGKIIFECKSMWTSQCS